MNDIDETIKHQLHAIQIALIELGKEIQEIKRKL